MARKKLRRVCCALVFLIWTGQNPDTEPVQWTDSGTLVFVGPASDGIVIEADTLVLRTVSGGSGHGRKIIPIGKFGVLAWHGSTVISYENKEFIDIPSIARRWAASHPSATVETAARELPDEISRTVTDWFSHHRAKMPPLPRNEARLGFILAGYSEMKEKVLFRIKLWDPDPLSGRPRVTINFEPLGRSAPVTGGAYEVTDELLYGKHNALASYKANPKIARFRYQYAFGSLPQMTTEEYLDVARICFEATESTQGAEFDSESRTVGPPHSIAIIYKDRGFVWKFKGPEPMTTDRSGLHHSSGDSLRPEDPGLVYDPASTPITEQAEYSSRQTS